jgi:AraC-like DNA-binding protein
MNLKTYRFKNMDCGTSCKREAPNRSKPTAFPTENALEPNFSREARSYSDVYRWSLTDKERLEWVGFGSRLLNALRVFSCGTFVEAHGHHMERKGLDEGILLYCTAGKGWYRIDGIEYEVNPGDLLYCPPFSHHGYWADQRTPWSICWAHLSGDLLPFYEELLGFNMFSSPRHIGLHDEIIEAFTTLILHPPLSGVDAACCFQIQARAIAILCALTTLPHNIAEIAAAYGPVQKALTLMRSSLHQPFNLDLFSQEAGYSRRQFFRQFRRVTGMTPSDWFLKQKMHRARELLTTPGIRIKEVAMRLGYTDPLYFSRIFKKIIGSSPEAYREKIRKRL